MVPHLVNGLRSHGPGHNSSNRNARRMGRLDVRTERPRLGAYPSHTGRFPTVLSHRRAGDSGLSWGQQTVANV